MTTELFFVVTVSLFALALGAFTLFRLSKAGTESAKDNLNTLIATRKALNESVEQILNLQKENLEMNAALVSARVYIKQLLVVLDKNALEYPQPPQLLQIKIPAIQENKDRLLKAIRQHFSISELNDMMYGLGVNPEDIGGDTKNDRSLAFVIYMDSRGRRDDLLQYMKQSRPLMEWN